MKGLGRVFCYINANLRNNMPTFINGCGMSIYYKNRPRSLHFVTWILLENPSQLGVTFRWNDRVSLIHEWLDEVRRIVFVIATRRNCPRDTSHRTFLPPTNKKETPRPRIFPARHDVFPSVWMSFSPSPTPLRIAQMDTRCNLRAKNGF